MSQTEGVHACNVVNFLSLADTPQAPPADFPSVSRLASSRRCLTHHRDPRLKRCRPSLTGQEAWKHAATSRSSGRESDSSGVCPSDCTRGDGAFWGPPSFARDVRAAHVCPHSDGKLPDFSTIPFHPDASSLQNIFLSQRRPSLEALSSSAASFASLFALHACPRLNEKEFESASPALHDGRLYLILDLDNTIVHAFGCSKINADIPLTDWVDEEGRGHLFRFASGAFSGASAASGTPTSSATVTPSATCVRPHPQQYAELLCPKEQKEERYTSSSLDRGAVALEGTSNTAVCQPTERRHDSQKACVRTQERKGGDASESQSNRVPQPGAPFGLGKEEYYLKLRPFVREFLELLSEYFELAICTAGLEEYAEALLTVLDPDGKYFGAR